MSHASPFSEIPADWREANRSRWDERVPLHVSSDFYDVEGFKRGELPLRPFEIEDLGDVTGKTLVHLQCHFGLDTLSWAHLGARVTGLDFSAPAVEAARAIAAELGLDARFVVSDVYDAHVALRSIEEGRQAPALDGTTDVALAEAVREPGAPPRYDIVYTGLGALCWLPDLERWADVAAPLVKPGGTFYIAEFHPLTDIFAEETLDVRYPYFDDGQPYVDTTVGTYTDASLPTQQNLSYEWTHPVSRVIDALLQRGLILERFREFDWTLFKRWPFLERHGRDTYRLPSGTPKLPLMYAARFRQPPV